MIPLSPAEIQELRALISQHWTALEVRTFGPAAVGLGAGDVQALVDAGILDASTVGMIDPWKDSYLIGHLRQKAVESGLDLASMSWPEVRAAIAASPLPLTATEAAAIEIAQQTAGLYCHGLGNRLENEILSAYNLEDLQLRQETMELIQDETASALSRHRGARNLASRLAEVTQDYSRDWTRIANTELHDAQEHGFAAAVRNEHGRDTLVAKLTNPDACAACIRAYTEDGRPRIFTLAELEENGTNVGRKQADWLPVVGVMHPHCDCRLIHVPAGFGFNEFGQLEPTGSAAEPDGGLDV